MSSLSTKLPRVTIQFCTQCKWMLRAAYFAQELLSTFGTALGEVALQPSTGGTFIVELFYAGDSVTSLDDVSVQRHVLWDRKVEGRFPETKELKRKVRDIIEPGRDLGHVDGKSKSVVSNPGAAYTSVSTAEDAPKPQMVPSEVPKAISPLQDEERQRKFTPMDIVPRAISQLQNQQSERKFTPMDVDIIETGDEKVETAKGEDPETEVRRNPDGSICEDCL